MVNKWLDSILSYFPAYAHVESTLAALGQADTTGAALAVKSCERLQPCALLAEAGLAATAIRHRLCPCMLLTDMLQMNKRGDGI